MVQGLANEFAGFEQETTIFYGSPERERHKVTIRRSAL